MFNNLLKYILNNQYERKKDKCQRSNLQVDDDYQYDLYAYTQY